MSNILPEPFYLQSTEMIAQKLIGCILTKVTSGKTMSAKIVETEAYTESDPASHSYMGLRKRNAHMFLEGGITYVYLIYGIHHCLNIVTEEKGKGCAVLLRAAQPIKGIDIMKRNRGLHHPYKETTLCKGPGNLAKAFNISLKDSGIPVWKDDFFIEKGTPEKPVLTSARVGISKGKEQFWRFFESNNPYVS
jgi:DNA-3-methyladenine glycosylase